MGYFSTYTDKYLQITTLSHLYTHKLTSNYIKPHLNTLEHLSLHVWNILTCRYMWDKSYIPLHPPTCRAMWDMYVNVDKGGRCRCMYVDVGYVGKGKKLRTSPYTPLQLLNTDSYPSLIFFTTLLIMGWGLLFSYP